MIHYVRFSLETDIAGCFASIPASCIFLLLSLLQFDLLTVSHAMPGPIHLHLFSEIA